MSQIIFRPSLLAMAVVLSYAALPTVAHAATDPQQAQATRAFDLPAGDLGETLSRIARDSGRVLSVAPQLLSGKRASRVSGQLTPEQAVQQALVGSGLGLTTTPSGTWSLYLLPTGSALQLQPTHIQGQDQEQAWGPVDGYVATRSATATKTDTPILEIPQTINVVTADPVSYTHLTLPTIYSV